MQQAYVCRDDPTISPTGIEAEDAHQSAAGAPKADVIRGSII
jgi:hypothetical protein